MSRSERRPRRFFSSVPLIQNGQTILLEPDETRHLAQTLRLKAGDACLVFDNQGHEASGTILDFFQDQAKIKVDHLKPGMPTARPRPLFFYVAYPQRGKMDDLIEKAQELEVEAFTPIETERTVVRLSDEKQDKVLARWKKISLEASKQSGALKPLKIQAPQAFKQALRGIGQDPSALVLVFHAESGEDWKDWRHRVQRHSVRSIYAFIGPEGGFSDREIDWAKSEGASILKLEGAVLKVDTAFLATASLLKYAL